MRAATATVSSSRSAPSAGDRHLRSKEGEVPHRTPPATPSRTATVPSTPVSIPRNRHETAVEPPQGSFLILDVGEGDFLPHRVLRAY